MVFYCCAKVLENSMECSHISHRPQVQGCCNQPGRSDEILQGHCVPPFSYQTTKTMGPLTLVFPRESHAGRRSLEVCTDVQPEKGHVSQKEKDCTHVIWCCMKKLQPSQRWTHNEWDHNTPWLGLRSAMHTSGPLRKAKAYAKTENQTQRGHCMSLSLFPMWPHWINLLPLLISITYLFNWSFVCFLFGKRLNLAN